MTKDHAYLYLSSISEAKRQNEVALWRASHLENIACKQAIEEAIRKGFDGMHLSHDCARGVMVGQTRSSSYNSSGIVSHFCGIPRMIG